MTIIAGWLPPSRENWELVVFVFSVFPLVAIVQWAMILNIIPSWYPMGKTSQPGRFNIPGKIGWATMETPGYLTLLYMVYALPREEGIERLPWPNIAMAGMFTVHYIYRSIIHAYLCPSISPINPILWFGAVVFNVMNGLSIGGWLGGYGFRDIQDWQGQRNAVRVELGMMIWAVAFMSNIFHDDELREIRRSAAREQQAKQESQGEKQKAGEGIRKVYQVPGTGLFSVVLYAHYFSEWIEWGGYWLMGGMSFAPGRIFLVNEVATMLPRAVQGKNWYLERFGQAKIGNRKAVIPGLL